MKENAHKFKRADERSKSPNESPAHTSRKVLAKLNSLKMSSFKSLSMQEVKLYCCVFLNIMYLIAYFYFQRDEPPEPPEGDIPKCDSTYSIDIPRSITLWEADPRPANSAEYYQFTNFAMTLNEMEPNMKPPKTLCPTDSRLRPDIRKLETGDIDGSATEKTRLEEKQRETKKGRKSKKSEEGPASKWFSQGLNPHTKQDDWLYGGGYWDRNYGPEIETIF